MHKITLLCVGKIRSPWIADGCAEYVSRLRAAASLMVYELTPSKFPDPARQRDDECGRLLETARKLGGETWVLDEAGKGFTSQAFAQDLSRAKDMGHPVLFILGGAYGLNDVVRATATRVIRLSEMTFPHELCRLVFLEQLYRATEISKGSGYHH
jgi:23S rRNA (pseudouridine1915-N3)-methyltransferase